jgi:WS/DGAT/MGAT family acyltransferase
MQQQPHLSRRLSALDAAFVYAENATSPMHIGGIDILDSAPSLQAIQEDLDAKMQFIPRYRQRLQTTPLNLGHPVWLDDTEFDIKNHVIGLTLPKPGTMTQFRRLVSKLFGVVLDRKRPLWRLYVIDGLEGGKAGLLWLVHHCMVDGVSGAELLNVAYDLTPNPAPVEKKPFNPEPAPDSNSLLLDSLWDNFSEQIETWSEVQRNLLNFARSFRGGQGFPLLRELPGMARDLAQPVRRLPFNTYQFSGKRKLSWSACSFAEARAIRGNCGGTVNDVVLTALGGGVRRYLEHHGYKVGKKNLRVMVPVSVRQESERGTLGNKVSLLPVDVQMGQKDPVKRLEAVTERTNILKKIKLADLLSILTQTMQGAPAPVQALMGAMAVSPASQSVLNAAMQTPGMHMVCTNVPGPQIPLYARGCRIDAHYPLLPVAPGMGLNMGVFSYNRKLHFGYIADTNAAPDVEFFAQCVDEAFAELREAAGVQQMEEIAIGAKPALKTTTGNGKSSAKRATAMGNTLKMEVDPTAQPESLQPA